MLIVLAYFMIVSSLVLVCAKKMSALAGLIISSTIAGPLACVVNGVPLTDLFSWFKDELFYTLSDSGSVKLGTTSSGVMTLFAVLYFSLVMNVGPFDPLCTFLIRKAKGDPLKVMMVATLTSRVVALDGDGITTILTVTAAFIPLFRKMDMKLFNLAMTTILSCSTGNCLPWGGPLTRAASVINVDVNVLFRAFLLVLGVDLVYVIVPAYFLGTAERERLGYVKGGREIISAAQIEEMCAAITRSDRESKRPKLFVFNLVFTLVLMVAMIMGLVSGALLFMVGIGIVTAVNYGLKEQRERIAANGASTISVATTITAVGCFMGVLNSSGMAMTLAVNLASLTPESFDTCIPITSALIGAAACWALSVDAYYFGILPVIVPITTRFGVGVVGITMASMMDQVVRYGNLIVARLFLLIDRTEMNFGDHLKTFMKHAIPMYLVFIVTALALGLFHL